MTRFLIAGALVLVASSPALAQDMPLSQILIDGEGWKKAEEKDEMIAVAAQVVPVLGGDGAPLHYRVMFKSGKWIEVENLPGVPIPPKAKVVNPTPRDKPTAALLTPDGSTLYLGGGAQRHLWAYRIEKDGTATARDRYAPLRVKRGELTTAVTALATDRDGRIYAATPLGIQVFDPTGRLCGVLTPAAPGKPEFMAFEGDTLTLWIDDTKYARKLRTEGAK